MNTFGRIFRITSFGESHGPALGGVVDGCPPGLKLGAADIQRDLARRRPAQSKFTTQRREPDEIEILSGVFQGKTTGAPLGLLIRNRDARSKDYDAIKNLYRPGHADFTYQAKYGIRDHRGGGRSSARETAIRVAAGAIARKYLKEQFGIEIIAHIIQVAEVCAAPDILSGSKRANSKTINANPFFCADRKMVAELEELFTKLRKENDSVGACIRAEARGVPAGWGSPVFARLDADIAAAMMSINAAKGVDIGAGFDVVRQRGSEHRDEMQPDGDAAGGKGGKSGATDKNSSGGAAKGRQAAAAPQFLSNHAGGILGGISSGQTLTARVAFKPTSSILKPGKTVTRAGKPTSVVVKGRHDPCVAIRAVPIVEAMLALVLMDHFLLHRAQCG